MNGHNWLAQRMRNAGIQFRQEDNAFLTCSLKQYVRNGLDLRVEGTMNNTWDLRLPKALDNLPALREIMKPINERYLDVQQDVLETYLDGGQLAQLRMPTQLGSRRVPGLKLDDARLLAVMEALVQFAPLAVDGVFRSKDLHARVARALGKTTETYKSSQLRYDLSKLRVKGLVQKVEGTQGYRLTDEGYRVCLFFLKVHQRLLAPVTSATQEPSATDPQLPEERRSKLDRLYVQLDRALQALSVEVGLRPAA